MRRVQSARPTRPTRSAPMLRIALPNKGRLADEARELFNDAGLEVRALGYRALTASLGGEFEALFVRAQDIPEFVADGAADAGVTGLDLVAEAGQPVEVVPVSGAAEIAPHLGIADIIVDITSTGSTLKMNGMREVATV